MTSQTSWHRAFIPVLVVPIVLILIGPRDAAGGTLTFGAMLFFAWATSLPTTIRIDETHVFYRIGIIAHLRLLPKRFRHERIVPLKKIDWVDLHKGWGNDWTVQPNVADGAYKSYLFVAHGDRLGETFRERGVFVREEKPGDGTGARGKPQEIE